MGVRFLRISGEARKFIARAPLDYLKARKVAPELLEALNTLVIEIIHSEAKVD